MGCLFPCVFCFVFGFKHEDICYVANSARWSDVNANEKRLL